MSEYVEIELLRVYCGESDRIDGRPVYEVLVELAREFVTSFALAQLDAGADVIMVADPTATGEILGAVVVGDRATDVIHELLLARKAERVR